MNIIVKTASGKYIVRPDTTWERDNEDFFVPEFVGGLSWAPVLFARVSKPGRSIGEKFGERYYDGIGYGVLLYPEDMLDGSEEGFACASCLDHTSFLPFPVFEKEGFEGNHAFRVRLSKGGEEEVEIFCCGEEKIPDQVRNDGAQDCDGGKECDGEKDCDGMEQAAGLVRKAIAEATRFIYIRIGDLIAIELQPRKHLCSRGDSSVYLKGKVDVSSVIDFRIIF